MSSLKPRRIAAAALTNLCREMGLGTMAVHFLADDPAQWIVHDYEMLWFARNGKGVAEVLIREGDGAYFCHVAIPDIYQVIRKPAEFDPGAHGIQPCTRFTIHGDKLHPDILADVAVEDSPALSAPQVNVVRHYAGRKPNVNSAFSR